MPPFPLWVATLIVAPLLLACAPDSFAPVAWNPPPALGFTGPFKDVQNLAPISSFQTLDGHGPETIIAGPAGWLFTGLKDGRVLRFRPDGSAMEVIANTGGRPNGLAFDHQGDLLVADSYRGLLSIDAVGKVEVLADSADGQPFVFTDGLDIASDGTVWFTDATSRFPDGQFHYDILEGRSTGRLVTYEPDTGETQVRATGLRFPNGIALGPRDEYVLINETLGYRTLRHWISGPNAGKTEPFVEGYPGMPDDIRYNDNGLFWVAIVGDRIPFVDWLQIHPWLKNVVGQLFGWAIPDTDSAWILDPAMAVAVDTTGRVVHVQRDASMRSIGSTSVLEYEGQLFVGSIAMNSIGVARLPD